MIDIMTFPSLWLWRPKGSGEAIDTHTCVKVWLLPALRILPGSPVSPERKYQRDYYEGI